ncbi:unnamed protein product [Brassica oleracea var. botrytis]
MEKMKEDGVLSDSITYSSLIKGYADQGLTDSAFGVLKCMLDAGCEPSHHMFLSLIKHLGYHRLEMYKEAAKVVDDMICVGQLPQLESCKSLICGLYKNEENERGAWVFKSLLQCRLLIARKGLFTRG